MELDILRLLQRPMYINFKGISNLILTPTFGDSSKLARMSSATCKDNKRKRDCRNIGNAE